MPGITSAGAGSGIDFESIISSSVDAYKATKETQLQDQQEDNDTQISGYGTLKSEMDKFTDALEDLNDLRDFQKRSSSIKQDEENEFLSAEVSNDALIGTYSVEVMQTAQGSRAMSAENAFSSQKDVVAPDSGGTLTFSAGEETFDVNVTQGMTLAQLSEAINLAGEDKGIGSTIINTGSGARLVYSSTVTGDGNDLSVTSSNGALDQLTTGAGNMEIAAEDQARGAIITIDGTTVTSDSNTFEDVITDVDLTLAERTEVGSTATLTVDRDEQGLKDSMKTFVDSYNSLIDEINNLTKSGGDLDGNTTVKGLKDNIYRSLSSHVDNNGTLNTIWAAGFDIDNNGKMSVDSERLDEIVDGFYDQIGGLLAGDSGVFTNVLNGLEPFTQRGGMIDDWQDRLEQDQDDISDRLSDIAVDRSQYEQQLRRTYGNLDARLSEMYAQQNYVSSLMSSL